MSSGDVAVSMSPPPQDMSQPGIARRPSDAFEDLLNSVKALTSQNFFTEVENMVAEAASLRDETKRLKDEIENVQLATGKELKDASERHTHTNTEIIRLHSKSVAELEEEKKKLQAEAAALQTKLDEEERKSTVTQKLNSELEQKNAEYADQCKEETEKLNQAKEELQQVRSEFEASKEELEKANENIKAQGIQISRLNLSLKDLEDGNKVLTAKLEKSGAKLQRIAGLTERLVENDLIDVFARLQESWQSCLEATRLLFEEDLSEALLKDPAAWRKLKGANQVTHLIPLPPSNSREAKHMRTIVVLAILAASLTQNIFTSTYLLNDDSELQQILLHFAETNSRKEMLCRGLLLSIPEEKQLEVIGVRVSNVIQEVGDRIQDLVSPVALKTFQSELERILNITAKSWQTVQRRRSRFETETRTESEDSWKWREIEFIEDEIQIAAHDVLAADFAGNEPLLVVFPRVFIVDDEKDTPVFPGTVLRRSQTAAADQEMQRIKASSPLTGRTSLARSARPRGKTFTGAGQNGTLTPDGEPFLGQKQ